MLDTTNAAPRLQKNDPWNPCFGGRISNVGACWVRNSDDWSFSVEGHAEGQYTLRCGNGQVIKVATDDLPEQFRPT